VTTPTTLTSRQLNRALLARQHLLDRSAMPPSAMVTHLVALQAQNPQDPYVGLWSRLERFDPAGVSAALERRELVRLGLLRTTLHLVTAEDARRLWPILEPVLGRAWSSGPFRKDLEGVEMSAVLAAAHGMLGETRTIAELGRLLAAEFPGRRPTSLAYAARFLLPIVQVPPRGLWGRTGQAAWRHVDAWVEADPSTARNGSSDERSGVPDLVMRYLAAFGPATPADVSTWSWLTGIREVFEGLRPRLRVYRDPAGRELFDLPDAPLPHSDTPAPVRFLPEFDNVALSHADRARIMAPEAVGRLTGFVGTFLVDGFVAGQWRVARRGDRATLVIDPFVPVGGGERDDLQAEGASLLEFLAGGAGERDVAFGVARVSRSERAPDPTG
jgi:hypothetical protein